MTAYSDAFTTRLDEDVVAAQPARKAKLDALHILGYD